MASGTASPAPGGSQASPAGAHDRRQLDIDAQILAARRTLRNVDLGGAALTLAAGVLVYLLAMAVLDHWVIPGGLGPGARALAFGVLLAGGVLYLVRGVLPPLVRSVNPVYAAQTIEQSRPTLKNSLINFLLLRSRPQDMPPVVYDAITERAAADLSRVSASAAIDRSKLIKVLYALAAAVVVLAVYLLASPKDPLRSMGRVLAPWADLAPPTRVSIDEIAPGDVQAYHDERVKISARIRGLRDGETVRLVYSTLDKQVVGRELAMRLPDNDTRHAVDLPDDKAGLQQDLQYAIRAGDATSPPFRVRVSTVPAITVERVEYKYPAYAEIAPRTVEKQGDLRALEGTEVTLHARATHAIKSAALDYDRDGKQLVPMSSKDRTASVRATLRLKPGTDEPEHSNYQLLFTTADGHDNPKPIEHKIEVVRDLAPEVAFIEPKADPQTEQLLPERGQLRLAVQAADPDFKLGGVTLFVERGGKEILKQPLLDKPQAGKFAAEFTLDAGRLGLKAGELIHYWAAAMDNKQPTPNRAETARFKVRIGSPQPQPKPQDQLAQVPPEKQQPRPNEKPQPDANQQQQPPRDQQPNGKPADKQPGEKPSQEQPQQGPRDGQPQNQPSRKDERVDPDTDPGKAIDEINQHFDKQQPQPKPGEKANDKPPDKQDKPQQGDQQQGDQKSGEGGGSQQQKQGGGQGGDQSKSKPQSGGQKGEQADQDQPADKPSGGQKGEQQQSQKPSETGDDGSQAGEKTGQQQAADPKSGGKPQEGSDPGGKGMTEKQSGDGSQDGQGRQNGEPSGNSGSQKSGTQQPGESQSRDGNQSGQQQGNQQQSDGSRRRDGQSQQPGQQPKDGDGRQEGTGPQDGSAPKDGAGPKDNAEPKNGGEPNSGGQPMNGSQPGGKPGDEKQGGQQPAPGDKQMPGEGGEKESPGKTPSDNQQPGKSPDLNGDKPGQGAQTQGSDKKDERQQPGEQKQPGAKGGDAESEKGGAGSGQSSGDKAGSPTPQDANRPRDKMPGSEPNEAKDKPEGSEAKSPSNSKNESDSKGETSGDRSGGGEDGGGQRANQKGTGGPGQNTSSDEGGGQSNEKGDGVTGPKGGNQQRADKPTENGQSSNEKGAGSQTRPGESKPGEGNRPEGNQQQPRGKPDGGQPQNENNDARGSGDHGPGDPGGGNPRTNQDVPPPQRPGQEPGGEEANLEYARKATDLAIERLKDQLAKGKPDQELLDKLKWSREDMQRFVERWEQMKRDAAASGQQGQAAREQLDETLKSLGLRPRGTSLGGDALKGDQSRKLQEGRRTAPPPEYADQYRAYSTGTSQGRGK